MEFSELTKATVPIVICLRSEEKKYTSQREISRARKTDPVHQGRYATDIEILLSDLSIYVVLRKMYLQ